MNEGHQGVIVAVGEILFDKFPDYQRIGGAPFNFAYHLKALGFEVRFISRIGSDENGSTILGLLQDAQFRTDDIQVDKMHRTGEVLIKLQTNGNAQFNILPDVAYDYIESDTSVKLLLNQAELYYFGSLVQRSNHGFQALQAMADATNRTTRCLYDVNLRPNCYNESIVRNSLQKANVVKLNDEEIDVIQKLFNSNQDSETFIKALMRDYDLDLVSVTKGEAGSSLYTKEGCFNAESQRDIKVVDTVGAGDGYAAILAIGYLHNWQPEKILEVAAEFASRICEIQGAFPSDRQFYRDFQLKIHGGYNEKT
jgi:fructokinase